MAKFKNKYRIEPNRWQYWDYSAPGDYFITIVTQNRENIFGHIENGIMILSEYGKIVENEFPKINEYHQRAQMGEFVVMPNHVHCIIRLLENGIGDDTVEKIHEFSLRPSPNSPTPPSPNSPSQPPSPPPSVIKQNRELTNDEIKQYRKIRRNMVLVKILGKFQQQTSKQINILRNSPGAKNWQASYHDHVIRDDAEYQRIKLYIINNPKKWNEDKFNSGD